MKYDRSTLIAKVLSYQPGFTDPDPAIEPHLRFISSRYGELKMTTSFEQASLLARSEWVHSILKQSVDDMLAVLDAYDLARNTLQKIAGSDYRGHRPAESVIAFKALEQLGDRPLPRTEDTELLDWVASYWESQSTGPQTLILPTMDNVSGGFRDAIRAHRAKPVPIPFT